MNDGLGDPNEIRRAILRDGRSAIRDLDEGDWRAIDLDEVEIRIPEKLWRHIASINDAVRDLEGIGAESLAAAASTLSFALTQLIALAISSDGERRRRDLRDGLSRLGRTGAIPDEETLLRERRAEVERALSDLEKISTIG